MRLKRVQQLSLHTQKKYKIQRKFIKKIEKQKELILILIFLSSTNVRKGNATKNIYTVQKLAF